MERCDQHALEHEHCYCAEDMKHIKLTAAMPYTPGKGRQSCAALTAAPTHLQMDQMPEYCRCTVPMGSALTMGGHSTLPRAFLGTTPSRASGRVHSSVCQSP